MLGYFANRSSVNLRIDFVGVFVSHVCGAGVCIVIADVVVVVIAVGVVDVVVVLDTPL